MLVLFQSEQNSYCLTLPEKVFLLTTEKDKNLILVREKCFKKVELKKSPLWQNLHNEEFPICIDLQFVHDKLKIVHKLQILNIRGFLI